MTDKQAHEIVVKSLRRIQFILEEVDVGLDEIDIVTEYIKRLAGLLDKLEVAVIRVATQDDTTDGSLVMCAVEVAMKYVAMKYQKDETSPSE